MSAFRFLSLTSISRHPWRSRSLGVVSTRLLHPVRERNESGAVLGLEPIEESVCRRLELKQLRTGDALAGVEH